MNEVFKEITEGVQNIESRMHEYSEMNAFMCSHNKMYLIATNTLYKTPEYNYQPYTFKYGNYSLSDYIKSYV